MSDLSGLVSMPGSLNLTQLRATALEGFALARRETILLKTGAHTLAGDADVVLADCAAGSFTITLPAAPVDGDDYEFILVSAVNTLTIGRNAKNINGAAADVTISTQWASKRLTWSASLNSWVSR